MKSATIGLCVTVMALTAVAKLGPAGVHGEPPDDTRAWAECDRNRPNPPKITAVDGKPPSDAFVIVGMNRERTLSNFTHSDGSPLRWDFKDGVLQINRKGPCGYVKGEWADFQLHVEWMTPKGCEKQKWGGNSGVVIHPGRRYEIQIIDSSRCDGSLGDANPAPDYADGQAGAVYGQTPPLVNPARLPGEWQTYDIIFHAALWEKGVLIHPATVSVIYNGVLVQDNWELRERVPPPKDDKRSGRIYFQNHGYDVSFRNVWLRELKPRWENDTHGGPYVKPDKVRDLREKTAAELFAEYDPSAAPSAELVNQTLEIICYSRDARYLKAVDREEKRYLAALEKMDRTMLDAQRAGLLRLKLVYGGLVGWKIIEDGRPLQRKCEELIKKYDYKGTTYWW